MHILFYDSVILLCNKRGTVQKDEWILIIQADFLFFFLISSTTPTLKDARSDKEI